MRSTLIWNMLCSNTKKVQTVEKSSGFLYVEIFADTHACCWNFYLFLKFLPNTSVQNLRSRYLCIGVNKNMLPKNSKLKRKVAEKGVPVKYKKRGKQNNQAASFRTTGYGHNALSTSQATSALARHWGAMHLECLIHPWITPTSVSSHASSIACRRGMCTEGCRSTTFLRLAVKTSSMGFRNATYSHFFDGLHHSYCLVVWERCGVCPGMWEYGLCCMFQGQHDHGGQHGYWDAVMLWCSRHAGQE